MKDEFIDANKVIYTVEKTIEVLGVNIVVFTSSKDTRVSSPSNRRRYVQDLYTFMLDKKVYKED